MYSKYICSLPFVEFPIFRLHWTRQSYLFRISNGYFDAYNESQSSEACWKWSCSVRLGSTYHMDLSLPCSTPTVLFTIIVIGGITATCVQIRSFSARWDWPRPRWFCAWSPNGGFSISGGRWDARSSAGGLGKKLNRSLHRFPSHQSG